MLRLGLHTTADRAAEVAEVAEVAERACDAIGRRTVATEGDAEHFEHIAEQYRIEPGPA
ncbi:hypothetical protein [Nocardiopsis sp. CNR-923]|uniref:hypothetical protein n=1 Tax=Nocardiopsis sp. CNR-923 TaxID=1904965 RepID=UPI001301629B|nr:hypothetical protein [Nocardiopsis sp. CNR-923]